MLHKDLLNLVFLEFENGHDMINFSELNHKCNQIFRQQIKIEDDLDIKLMYNNQGQKHGIARTWYPTYLTGQLWYEENYVRGQRHGISRGWYESGKLEYKHNYYQNQLHGICRAWHPTEKLWFEDNYIHGQRQIEK